MGKLASYEQRYPIETEGIVGEGAPFSYLKVIPYLPGHRTFMPDAYGQVKEIAFTGWRDESLAWHKTCIVHAGLNPTPQTIISGPDALEFCRRAFVNKVDKFPIGTSKHGIMCTSEGYVAAQGVLMRIDEDTYEMSWASPWIDYVATLFPELDVTLTDVTSERFMFQIQGPRSLELVEDVCEEDLHDLKFCRFRSSKIRGHEVTVFRFGMAGVLGYEVQGSIEDAHDVYMAIIEAGSPYGLRRMGSKSYDLNHTVGGNVQLTTHFFSGADADPGFRRFFAQYCREAGWGRPGEEATMNLAMDGSLGDDLALRLVNPIEIGLERIIDFDNPKFLGYEAISAYRKEPKRGLVTLEWNAEDLCDIYISQFRDEEPFFPMDEPCESEDRGPVVSMDRVFDPEGKEIGYSSGREMALWYRAMVSLGVMDLDYCVEGTQVVILYGDEGTRQKRVRATVARFPYNTHLDNRTFDVESIPHYADRHVC